MPPSTPTFHACYREIDRYARCAAKYYRMGSETDDVVQEVLYKISLQWAEYDPHKSLKGWVWQFTRRVCADIRGRAYHSREVNGDGVVIDEPDQHLDPEQQAQLAERYALLIELLRPMDEDRRIVFELKELDGFSGAEIAEALGIPSNTVFSRLRAARGELEERLARHKDRLGVVGIQALVWDAEQHDPFRELHDLAMDPPGDVGTPPGHGPPPTGGDGAPDASGALPANAAPPPVPAASAGAAAGAVAKVAIPITAIRLAGASVLVFTLGAGAGAVGHAWLGGPPEASPAPIGAEATARPRAPSDAGPPPEPAQGVSPPPPASPTAEKHDAGGADAQGPSRANGTTKEQHVIASAAPTATAVASAAPTATAVVSAAATVAAAPSVIVAAPTTASAEAHTPKDERLLIDKADIALQNGDLASARDALARHARQFPSSKWAGRRQDLLEQLKRMESKKMER